MKVYSADVKVAATAYIVAGSDEEAREIFEREFGKMTGDALPEGGIVDGSRFEAMIEEAHENGPFGALSPAVTFYGAFEGGPVELMVEFEEEVT